MNISSLFFIFAFLPASVILYILTKDKYKPILMLAISILFYSLNSVAFLPFMMLLCVADRLLCRGMSAEKNNKKTLLIFGVALNVLVLVFYKVINSFFAGLIPDKGIISSITSFPIGLSFFIFKSISYLTDSYTGKIVPSKNLVNDFLYLTFFPQVQSGPISRYLDMKYNKPDIKLLGEGTYRFLTGFCKKILIADLLGETVNVVFSSNIETISPLCAWIISICWSLELYFDFSGYSDMAIGISKMFGYDCPENFNYPYATPSISAFWRRWHITLGAWFRDYVYIPMGGSRKGSKAQLLFNLFIVWLLTGLWHGLTPNFIIWGMGYFVLIGFEKLTGLPGKIKPVPLKICYRIMSLVAINILWVIFRCDSIGFGFSFIARMFSFGYDGSFIDIRTANIIRNNFIFIIIGILLSTPLIPFIKDFCGKNDTLDRILCVVRPIVIVSFFLLSLSVVVSGINNPFAYANF